MEQSTTNMTRVSKGDVTPKSSSADERFATFVLPEVDVMYRVALSLTLSLIHI